MKRWKKITLAVLTAIAAAGLGLYFYMQSPVDLRTEHARVHGETQKEQAKGRALLAGAIEKLGGVERWRALREQAVTVTFEHDWHHWLLETFFMPMEFSGQKASLILRPGHLDARLRFHGGQRAVQTWGIANASTYTADADGAVSWEDDDAIAFQLLGYRFFFFVAFHLGDAELITHAGTRELRGNTYDLVFATWGQWEPHVAADQYLVWINRETGMVDFVQSTVREMVPRSVVALAVSDYREVLDGIRFPFSLKVLEDVEVLDRGMHHMRVQSIERATKGDTDLLRPERE